MPTTGPAAESPPSAIRLTNVSKHFGNATVLDKVSLAVDSGEIHALVGHNGSGKSTLVKIVSGYHSPDHGARIEVSGKLTPWPPRDVKSHGIAVVHQNLGLVGSMSVLDNFAVSLRYQRTKARSIPWSKLAEQCRASLDMIGLRVDPHTEVRSLDASSRALLAIARSISQLQHLGQTSGLLVLDEPTVFFEDEEVQRFLSRIQAIAEAGFGVIFVSHKISEILGISNRISVLRDGQLVATVQGAQTSRSELLSLMFGSDPASSLRPPAPAQSTGPLRLSAQNLSGKTVKDLTFDLQPGEILAFTGLRGMGQEELPYLLAGVAPHRGTLATDHGPHAPRGGPRHRRKARVSAVVPSDRPGLGLWLDGTAIENLTLPSLASFRKHGRIRHRRERAAAEQIMRQMNVRPLAPEMRVSGFSGGNQQKLLIGKWIISRPATLVVHEPTQGVDLQTRSDVIGLLVALAASGASLIVCSSDYDEIALLATRVIILRDGRAESELRRPDITPDAIARACHDIGV
jgi:ribose transport system ATP-binding protein